MKMAHEFCVVFTFIATIFNIDTVLYLLSARYCFCEVDPEDICRQSVSYHTAETVNVSALPGHERFAQ